MKVKIGIMPLILLMAAGGQSVFAAGERADMAYIPAGEFMMGSPDNVGKDNEHPLHKVYLDAFYMDKYEVTAGQYRQYCAAASKRMPFLPENTTDRHPMTNISWLAARDYCHWAGKRLPTEAEWEKAARGGENTKWLVGDSSATLGDYAWYDIEPAPAARGRKSKASPHIVNYAKPVGQKKPNRYGLYDISGNVYEWCSDWYDADYYRHSPLKNPQGPPAGTYKIERGGSWRNHADLVRLAIRNWSWHASSRGGSTGFRCVAEPEVHPEYRPPSP